MRLFLDIQKSYRDCINIVIVFTESKRRQTMQLTKIMISNFRGIKHCSLNLPSYTVLVGDNNTGKSTILEAIDLVLGPERLSKRPVIDEHDFFAGEYIDRENNPINIEIDAIIVDLNDVQETHFRNNLEWWNKKSNSLLEGPPVEATDLNDVVPALRIGFRGYYDAEEDDFCGDTFFLSPQSEEGTYDKFRIKDKRLCGFLYLRTLRTGNRALSLERGSLLDIILKLRELKPQMWEDVLSQLCDISVASDPKLGISEILSSVQAAVRKLMPVECADAPTVRISQMTRDHLRQVLTVFLGTGTCDGSGKEYSAPFHHQGTGTINTLVLTLLSMIADLKQNVIFAMEEPEIAIPPHTQKRVIKSVIGKSAQAIFTSHSPYVLEEFEPSHILIISRKDGELTGVASQYPPTVKAKTYREEIKRRFCEAFLARRVLIVEGRTEYDTFSRIAEKLQKLKPKEYASIEGLGIAVINAETDSQVAELGEYFKGLGKTTYAIFDHQDKDELEKIKSEIDFVYESPEKGFEKMVLNATGDAALRRYTTEVIAAGLWPAYLSTFSPDSVSIDTLKNELLEYFKHKKSDGSVADLLDQCTIEEMPKYVLDTLKAIHDTINPPKVSIVKAPEDTEQYAAEI